MKVSNLLAAAGAILTLSAGVALAAEACECCKDMAEAMSCCDKMAAPQAPAPDTTPPAPTAPAPDAREPAEPQHH